MTLTAKEQPRAAVISAARRRPRRGSARVAWARAHAKLVDQLQPGLVIVHVVPGHELRNSDADQPRLSRIGEGSMRAVPHGEEPTDELENLSEAECLRRLAVHDFGRLAIVVDGQPVIFPVNYAMLDRVIAIRTAPGTKLTYAPGEQVAFEIDGTDPPSGTGWSVLVQGRAVDATTALDDVSWTAHGASPHPAAPGRKAYRIAIEAQTVSGRTFGGVQAREAR